MLTKIIYRVRTLTGNEKVEQLTLSKGVSVILNKLSNNIEILSIHFTISSGWSIQKIDGWLSNYKTLMKHLNVSRTEANFIEKEGEFEMKINEITPTNVRELDKKMLFKLRNQLSVSYVSNFWYFAGLVLKEIDRRNYSKITKEIDNAFDKFQSRQGFLNTVGKIGDFAKSENEHAILLPADEDSMIHFGHHIFKCEMDKGITIVHCEECNRPAAYIFDKSVAQWTIEKAETWIGLRSGDTSVEKVDKYLDNRHNGENDWKIVRIVPGQEDIVEGAINVQLLPYNGMRGVYALYIPALMRIVGAVFYKDMGWTREKVNEFVKLYLSNIRSNTPKVSKTGDEISFDKFEKSLEENGVEARIIKVSKKEQIVKAVVYEPDVVDTDGEFMRQETIRKAMHNYMLKYGGQYKFMHRDKLTKRDAVVVEIFQSPVTYAEGKEVIREGSWVQTSKVLNKRLWKKIENGEITAYSIGGRGQRREYS